FIHAAIKMLKEHLFRKRRALAQGEHLQHLVFLARQMHALAVYLNRLRIAIDLKAAGFDDRLSVTLRAADDGMDTGHQFVLMEWFGHIIVGTEPKAANLVFDTGKT